MPWDPNSTLNKSGDAPPSYQGSQSQSQPANPIGVPYYITDPTTGKPMPDPNNPGQNLRWGATVPADINGPGSQGIQGPGTAPSSGSNYVLPRYFDGAQWLPAQLPPDLIANLQKKLVAAGVLKPGAANLGIWDSASVTAYSEVLKFANASGLDAQTALDRWAQTASQTPDQTKPPHSPLVTQVTNPDDLRAVFRKSVIDTLGQGWSQDKIDQMVNAYQAIERQSQQQKYDMTGKGSPIDLTTGLPVDPGTGGEITAPPNPADFATAQARAENPGLAQEHDALGMVNQFQQMVGSWSKIK